VDEERERVNFQRRRYWRKEEFFNENDLPQASDSSLIDRVEKRKKLLLNVPADA